MRNLLIISFLCLGSVMTSAQLHLGFNGGLTFSSLQGELEDGESYGTLSGFQISVRGTYDLNDWFAIGAGVGYVQKGTQKEYTGNSYFRLPRPGGSSFFFLGERQEDVRINTDHIEIPILFQFTPFKKVQLYAGPYVSFTVGARGAGRVRFREQSFNQEGWQFETAIQSSFFRDEGGFEREENAEIISVAGESVLLPETLGAYFERDNVSKSLYKPIDYGLHGGINLFVTSGFYFNGNISYGLNDITRNDIDISLENFNGGDFVNRDDFDRFLVYSLSIGFAF